MTKKKVIRKTNKSLNIFKDGGEITKFEDIVNSDYFQSLKKGISTLNLGVSSSQGKPSFLAMNQSKGKGLFGAIGSSVDTTGQLLSGIDSLLTKKRKPLEQTIGLVSSDGRRLYADGGILDDITNIGTTALALAGNAVQNAQIADTTNIKDQVEQFGNYTVKSNNLDDLMNEWGNKTELQHISHKDLRNRSLFGDFSNSLSSSAQGFSAGSVRGPWGAAVGGVVGGLSSLISSIVGRNKAKKEAKKVNKQIDIANAKNQKSFSTKASNIDSQNDFDILANFSAYGGPLGILGGYGDSAIGYELAKENLGIQTLNALNKGKITSLPNSFSSELNTFAEGGKIYIKPENRGKFTALKERTGKSATWFKEHGTPAQKKMATFALNARKWKHAFGGDLLTHGAEWDNGLTVIGNGGTHEESPYEGVPMGIDNEGIPNLVEEGEVIFNDYVFSNRLNVPDAVRKKYKLRGNKELTFANAAKQMQKESEERPNDPISKRGLKDSMYKLQQEQETVRQKNQIGHEGRQYAHGGKMGILFDGTGDIPNFLDTSLIDTSSENLIDIKKLEGSIPKSTEIKYGVIPKNVDSIKNNKNKLSWLRYAPALGSAIGLVQNLIDKPDYSRADTISEAANQIGNYTPIDYTPIGNYLSYDPFDLNYYTNILNAQSDATRRAIMNTSNPSRYAALLAADYNAQSKLGDLARQAEEYNLAQRQAVEQFNRGTNQANSEMGLKAAMANQEAELKARSAKLSGIAQAMKMKDDVDARRAASISTNMSNLFESLGNIGIDAYNMADRDFYINNSMGANLPLSEYNRLYGLEAAKKEAKNRGYTNEEIDKIFKKYGGKLNRRRGGLTY